MQEKSKNNIQIYLVQLAVDEKNPNGNISNALNCLSKLSKAPIGIAILPELFISGFNKKNINYAIENYKTHLLLFQNKAKEIQKAIIGTFAIKDTDDKNYNRAYFIDDKGEIIGYYDKTHLFRPMNEDKYFDRGNNYPIFKYKNWTIGLNICYDLRFPEASRILFKKGAELIILPAAWPYSKVDIFKKIIIARAIENQCYFVGVNQASPSYNKLTYGGNSLIVSPQGEEILNCNYIETIKEINISKDEVLSYRNQIQCKDDIRDKYV